MHSVPVVGRAVAFALLLSLLFVSNAVMAQRPAPTDPAWDATRLVLENAIAFRVAHSAWPTETAKDTAML